MSGNFVGTDVEGEQEWRRESGPDSCCDRVKEAWESVLALHHSLVSLAHAVYSLASRHQTRRCISGLSRTEPANRHGTAVEL